jgi:hypothetical protein
LITLRVHSEFTRNRTRSGGKFGLVMLRSGQKRQMALWTTLTDLKHVNAVLMQPHWRHNTRDEPTQPLVFTNQNPKGPG